MNQIECPLKSHDFFKPVADGSSLQLIKQFPSSKHFHSQTEEKCKTFLVKMSFICMRIKNNFHNMWLRTLLRFKADAWETRK